MKYILFGAGEIGEVALNAVGEEHIYCFADNFNFGTEFLGKKVISFDEMVSIAKDHQIIITSIKYFKELEKQLINANIENYIIFTDRYTLNMNEVLPTYNYLYNTQFMYYNDVLLNYEIFEYKRVAIFGTNKYISNLIFEFAIQNKLENLICIIDPEVIDKKICGIPVLKLEDVKDDIDCLIVNKRRYESDIRENLAKYDFSVVDIYDVDKFISYNIFPKLAKFKNINKGKRCFIIGNGPSLKIDDLDILRKNNEICFGFNKIYKVFEQTEWRPDYFCMTDMLVIEAMENVISEIAKNIEVFTADRYNYSDLKKHKHINYVHLKSEIFKPNQPGFSEDIVKGVNLGYSVVYDFGLQIAAYMGFTEIYLIGIDNNNVGVVTDERNHFIKDYFSEEEKEKYRKITADFESMNLAYKKAEKYSRENGFRIYNATRGGMLEEFERVDFDSLF